MTRQGGCLVTQGTTRHTVSEPDWAIVQASCGSCVCFPATSVGVGWGKELRGQLGTAAQHILGNADTTGYCLSLCGEVVRSYGMTAWRLNATVSVV